MDFSPSANASAKSTASTGIGGTGPNQIAAAFATWTIACACVCLRMWTRAKIVGVFTISDWVIVLALAAALGQCISKIEECLHGMGRHVQDIDFATESFDLLRAWWYSLLTYNLTLAFTKISICLLYLDIFTLPRARTACFILLGVVLLSSLWAIIAVVTATIPLRAIWDIKMKPTFVQSYAVWWSLAGYVLALLTDILIFTFPIPMIAPLNLCRRQKILVVGTFAIGFFVCTVSIIRLIILIRLVIVVRSKQTHNLDFTYNNTTITYWNVIEIHTGIVVACLMTLKPFVARFFPNLLDPRRASDTMGEIASENPLTIGSKPTGAVLAGILGGRKTEEEQGDEITMQDLESRNDSTVGLNGRNR
ncbi:hypothetical protein QBC43DRAFT_328123 [Cladorrhinum sp. PSN259]|nr:hypothetical protein QBC43DRAFT_328123 [Cladorrhinum sp. PSN259]